MLGRMGSLWESLLLNFGVGRQRQSYLQLHAAAVMSYSRRKSRLLKSLVELMIRLLVAVWCVVCVRQHY